MTFKVDCLDSEGGLDLTQPSTSVCGTLLSTILPDQT